MCGFNLQGKKCSSLYPYLPSPPPPPPPPLSLSLSLSLSLFSGWIFSLIPISFLTVTNFIASVVQTLVSRKCMQNSAYFSLQQHSWSIRYGGTELPSACQQSVQPAPSAASKHHYSVLWPNLCKPRLFGSCGSYWLDTVKQVVLLVYS